jgi:hypothetical protein
VQLAAAPLLALTVHEHLSVGQEGPNLAPVVDEPGQLQKLAQPDGVAADRNVGGHGAASLASPLAGRVAFEAAQKLAGLERRHAVVVFVAQGLVEGKRPLVVGRAPVAAQGRLRA